MEFRIVNIIDGLPTFEVPVNKIWEQCQIGGSIEVKDPIKYITDRQRRWYKGICLPTLSKNDENAETVAWWDTEVKKTCNGLEYLKKEIFFLDIYGGGRFPIGRLTTSGVGVRNMTKFIEEILSKSVEKGWPVSPPDPELRSK